MHQSGKSKGLYLKTISDCELSVLVPVLNGQEYIQKKVNNLILSFGFNPSVEVIFSLNKSEDSSENIFRDIESLLPGNFKVWYQTEKLKLNENLKLLLDKSAGKWVYFTAIEIGRAHV